MPQITGEHWLIYHNDKVLALMPKRSALIAIKKPSTQAGISKPARTKSNQTAKA